MPPVTALAQSNFNHLPNIEGGWALIKLIGRIAAAGILVFVLLQFFRPAIPARPAAAEIQAPPEIRNILETHCYACHSDQRRLSWFDEIVPGYWLVRHDILTARQHLNFSTLGAKPAAAQKATLYEAVAMVQLGAMPLPQFVALHPDARMKPEELDALKAYLAPWTQLPTPTDIPPSANGAPSKPAPDLSATSAEPGGLAFDPAFEGWKLLSITDRGDNYTLRFILGNSVAFNAARAGNIPPWPEDAHFAKIAWQQRIGSDGLIHPGAFVQVELMDKAAERYKSTDGWGWGRWRGLDLKPYGKDAGYVTECTGCHLPVRGNDFVYTLPITSAAAPRPEVVNNRAAALPAGLPYQPLAWSPITLYVDPREHTMSVLFGNPEAAAATHARSGSPEVPNYPAGAVLALVTWVQRDDPHWFGARIPDSPQSVEFVQAATSGQPSTYRRFSGTALAEDLKPANAGERMRFMLTLPPASLP